MNSSTQLVVARPATASTQITSQIAANTLPGSQLQQSFLNVCSTIEKEDIVSVFVAEQEEALHNERLAFQKELDALVIDQKKLAQKLGALGPKLVKTISTASAKRVAKSLETAGFGKHFVEVGLTNTDEQQREWTFTVSVNKSKEASSYSSYGNTLVSRQEKVSFTDEACELITQIAASGARIEQIQIKLVRNKQAATQVHTSFKNRVRAKLASIAVRTLADGDNVMRELSTVKMLPLG